MSLRMRLLVGLAVAVPQLLASVSCCGLCKPLIGDKVSGEPKGSALVKILVTLKDASATDKTCTAEVVPAHVHVFHGSAIRWRVVNNCTNPPAKHLTFTQPKLTQKVKGYDDAQAWNYRFCTATIATLANGDDAKNVLHCEVPDEVKPGHYKYGLEGAAKVDPEIEVHKGG